MSKKTELRAAAARLMYSDNRDTNDYNMLIDFIDNHADEQEQPERPKGQWEMYQSLMGYFYRRCSECGCVNPWEQTSKGMAKFCPECGADMREKEAKHGN